MSDFHTIESARGQFPLTLHPDKRESWDTGKFPRVMIMTPRLILEGTDEGQCVELDVYMKSTYHEDIVEDYAFDGSLRLHKSGEVEYYIDRGFKGNGFATEAVEGAKLFLAQRKISPFLRIKESNLDSQKVALKTGFYHAETIKAVTPEEDKKLYRLALAQKTVDAL
ncbi:MAG: GNAT family N-acetyltransferase [Firmicutes bacterium]|nr:GNAT family N-acetyltransferase [Bacillota bacterium]